MASVDQLLVALAERTRELASGEHPVPEEALRGWHRLARNATRILLVVDAPPEVMPILRTILKEDERRDAHVNAPITAIGYTLGVLADTVCSYTDVVAIASHADRAQLRSRILSSLHDAATATLAAAPAEANPPTTFIRDLAEATEPTTHVPLRPLQGPMGRLALGPDGGSLDQVVTRWAESATDILISRTRVTSYAFQRTAASIAGLCHTAAAAFSDPGEHRPTNLDAETALIGAFQAWQIAADWPSEIRLGGRTTELRCRSQDLDEAFAEDRFLAMVRTSKQDAMHSALLQAEKVAAGHELALIRLVGTGGLWIIADALGPAYLTRHPGVRRTDWVRDPGAVYGSTLTQAVHRANTALQQAVDKVDELRRGRTTLSTIRPAVWETIPARGRRSPGMRTDQSSPARSIGR